MKKKYINPEVKVIHIEAKQALLLPISGIDVGEQWARKNDFMDEEFSPDLLEDEEALWSDY